MKIYKKIGLGFGLLLLISSVLIVHPEQKVLAYLNSSPPITTSSVSLSFKDRSTISGTINGQAVTFTDSNPTDTTYNYSLQQSGSTNGTLFCNTPSININNGAIALTSSGSSSASSATGSVEFDVSKDGTASGCAGSSEIKTSFNNLPIDNVQAGMNYLAWQNSGSLVSGDGTTMTEVGASNLYESSTSDSCGGGTVAVVTDDGSGATVYKLTSTGIIGGGKAGGQSFPSASAFSDLASTSLASSCFVNGINGQDISSLTNNPQGLAAVKFGVSGTRQAAGTGGVGTGGTGSTTSSNDQGSGTTETTCEANSSGFSLSWAVCPILQAASSLTNGLLDIFEGQLSFTVSQLGNTNAANCGPTGAGTNCGAAKIHLSWSLVRDLASATLVVVMLIMVISQAIGGGPFDAYTVRKMLPRLVAAVILMQISWVLTAWVINLVNDIGNGLAAIMYYPFGGSDNMNLFALLKNAGLGSFQLGALDWAAIAVAGFLAYSFVFTMLGLAFMAIVALFAGVITLVFRKILIIALLIFAPLAILAWILPGTERYWKMWRDNLMKALFMFPIAVAIIAAGRILAYITGSQDNSSIATFGSGKFLSLIFVMVGFFGPLFILPKTFKWGGQAMQLAGNGISKAANKLGERPKKFLDTRQEGWSSERRRGSQERMSGKKEYGRFSKPILKPLDKFRSGAWDPTLGGRNSRRRFEATTGYQAAGRESSGKTFETAKNAAQQLFDTAQDHDYVARMLMRGKKFDYIDKRGRRRTYDPRGNGYLRAAGASGIAKYGTDGSNRAFQAEIDRMRAAGGEEAMLAEEILDDNVDKMKGKMDSMYRGFNRAAYVEHIRVNPGDEQGAIRAARLGSIKASVESMKENWFDGMEGVEAQSLLAGLSQGVAAGDVESEQRMEKLWQDYKKASANPNIHMAPGVHKAFKAYADGNLSSTSNGSITAINNARLGEVEDRLKGDIENPDGTVTRPSSGGRDGELVDLERQAVLDEIKNDDARNQALIARIGATGFTSHFDGDGSPLRPISREDIVSPTGPGDDTTINIAHPPEDDGST